MINVNLGRVGFVLRHDYVDGAECSPLDVVSRNNALWACRSRTTDIPTIVSPNWMRLISGVATDVLQALQDDLDELGALLAGHEAASNVHQATPDAAASRIILRDADGRAQVAAPVADSDIARKAEIDELANALTPATRLVSTTSPLAGGGSLESDLVISINAAGAATATVDGTSGSAIYAKGADTTSWNKAVTPAGLFAAAAVAATANKLALRDASGRMQTASPNATADVTNKGYVDTGLRSNKYDLCEFYFFRHPTLRAGFQPAQGGLLANAATAYPEAWAYLQTTEGQKLCKTESQWQALTTAIWATLADSTTVGWNGIGGAPFYAPNTSTGALRLPDLRGMYAEAAGFDSLGVGGVHGDGIRNLTGTVQAANDGGLHYNQGLSPTGIFVSMPTTTMYDSTTNNRYTSGPFGIKIDTSTQVPTANKNQGRAWGSLACVYLGQPAS